MQAPCSPCFALDGTVESFNSFDGEDVMLNGVGMLPQEELSDIIINVIIDES